MEKVSNVQQSNKKKQELPGAELLGQSSLELSFWAGAGSEHLGWSQNRTFGLELELELSFWAGAGTELLGWSWNQTLGLELDPNFWAGAGTELLGWS